MQTEATSKGKVSFVSAGPGDPGLLTLNAVRALQEADVILYDRLISTHILNSFPSASALLLPVGKEGGSNRSVKQEDINLLIVLHAEAGKKVARLKGGDTAIFSNVLSELQTVREAGIEYEIIPGITAASAASAYTGIPLTARKYSNGIRILTYHDDHSISESDWEDISRTSDTLVFYMSGRRLQKLAEKLFDHGFAKTEKIAVVEQASTPQQQVHIHPIEEVLKGGRAPISPSLIIVGKVVELYREFAWYKGSDFPGNYFNSLINIPNYVSRN